MSQRNLLLLTVASIFCYVCFVRAERSPYARYLAAAYSTIDRWALLEPEDHELFNGAMQGMIDVLEEQGDEHSQFIEAERAAAFREDIRQEFAGVGIMLSMLGDPPEPVVVAPPMPGTPAFQAGIRRGDRIVAVDGTKTDGLELSDIVRLVRGPEGDVVTLSVRFENDDLVREVPLKRAIITVESILGDLRDEEGQWQFRLQQHPEIGYVRITKFGNKTAEELQRVLAGLHAEDLHGLVLDLRDNYGGSLDAAIEVCDLFLPAGQTIVVTRGRSNRVLERFQSSGNGPYLDVPIAVLVNQNSASASEIVAACLQDHDRAEIVGQRTYGKGTVQRLLRTESGRSQLKLTTATYWRPSGKNIHRMPGEGQDDPQWGVMPDEGLDLTLSNEEHRNWQLYRARRDLRTGPEDPADELPPIAAEQELPADYSDRVLERAAELFLAL
ncbi:S41 family peptidase [Pirellulales bacterium]|nr:S41 family peptidase [Pirellulales bacterium]MDC0936073.1 S41 family peptidase [Pirellulales bacterium]